MKITKITLTASFIYVSHSKGSMDDNDMYITLYMYTHTHIYAHIQGIFSLHKWIVASQFFLDSDDHGDSQNGFSMEVHDDWMRSGVPGYPHDLSNLLHFQEGFSMVFP